MKKEEVNLYGSKFYHMKIVKCSNDNYWYKDLIGEVIRVRNIKYSAYCECDNGNTVLNSDVQPLNP